MASNTPARSKISSAHPHNRPRRRLSLLLLGAALSIANTVTAAPPLPEMSHTLTALKPAKAAKNFTLPDQDGKPHKLSDYRGKVVLVNFWATWCPPCRREMPSMERLSQRLKDQPFIILGINQQEDPERVFVFTAQVDPSPNFPILFDSNSKIANAWGVLGLPASFIVDQQGRVVYRAMGGREFDHPDIELAIRRLLKIRHAIK
jgi:thiol-disulfide isomerase/thioredoxin